MTTMSFAGTLVIAINALPNLHRTKHENNPFKNIFLTALTHQFTTWLNSILTQQIFVIETLAPDDFCVEGGFELSREQTKMCTGVDTTRFLRM